ncbi:uncharacterized protein LOC117337998 [Pecten maximus]|uniref:uncharacterized protein LOC117337998 n=1 Tax=Pecten maximus TaxID=6579 RepID=UPI0014587709|nr:uncharacterized protein LOC117337998 [Pecten maximus]
MSKTSEAETLRNQIKYLTDLINNAKKRKQGPTIKNTPLNVSREVKGHQQRAGAYHHVDYTKTELQRSGTGHGQQLQFQNTGHHKKGHAQESLKRGKYVWTKTSGKSDNSLVVSPEQTTISTQSCKKIQERGIKKTGCFSAEVRCSSNLSSLMCNDHSTKILENVPGVSGSSKGSCVKVRNMSSAKTSDHISLHSQEVKPAIPTATLKEISFIQNVSSNIVPTSSSSMADMSSSGLKSIKTQLVHKLKDSVSSSVRSVSVDSSLFKGKSTHIKCTTSTSNIPSLMKPEQSSQKTVLPTSTCKTSTKEVSGDKDVILLTVHSPEPVEQTRKTESCQTQEKVSVIPSFLKNHLKRKMSKEVKSELTSTNTVQKVETDFKMKESAPSLPASERLSSTVSLSGEYIACSEKETILPQTQSSGHPGAKSSSMPFEEYTTSDKISSDLSANKTVSLCQDSQKITSPTDSPGNKVSVLGPHSNSSLLIDTHARIQRASSSESQTLKSNPTIAAKPSKFSNAKFRQSKANMKSSAGSNSGSSLLPEMSKTNNQIIGQVSRSSSNSSLQKSSQQSQINSASFSSKTCITEKMDSRKDTVLQLSEQLAKTQAEIKRMTRNITNSRVTMKSIAAIKKEKSMSALQTHPAKVKSLQGMKTQKPYKMHGQGSSKGQKHPFKKAQTFPCRLNSPKFNSRLKMSSSKSRVVFDKKYSLNKKLTKTLETSSNSSPQTSRPAVTPSKTQVVAKVIKSKYKLWKVTSGVKSPPPRYDSKPPIFPGRTFPSNRGYSFSKSSSYHNHRGRGRGGINPYGFYPHMEMRRHHTYPGTRNRHGHTGQYTGHGYQVRKGMYPVTGRGFHHPYISQKTKKSYHLKSKAIFDKKYVLKRLQHNKNSPSRFKSDKRRQPGSVQPGAARVLSDLRSQHVSTLQPTRTLGKSSFVVINGMLYRSSSKSLIKTSPVKMAPVKSAASSVDKSSKTASIIVKKMQSKSMKLVTVRGVQFQMDAGGKTLQRVHSTSSSQGDSQQSQTTVKRLDIGGMTYVRNSQGALERVGSANTRVVANRVIHKSIAAATARYRKINDRNKLSKQYCLFFNRFGKCKRGSKCPYIHDPDKVAVCTRFLRGTCQMTGCPFSHKAAKEKMPVCSYFLRGVCNRDNCPYLHVKVNKNASVCQNFLKGFCSLGEKCKKQHTRECPAFSRTGQCPAGRTCPLVHKTKKDKEKKKRSMVTSVDKSGKEPDQQILKRTATDSGKTEEDTGLPFKLQKLPTFISLGSSPVPETLTSPEQAIRIKPQL